MKNSIRLFLMILSTFSAILFWIACGGGGATGVPPGPTASLSAASQTRVFTTDPVSVTFSGPMDQVSVEAAFAVTGSSGSVSGTFSWTDQTVTFTPDIRWKTHHQYTITIGTDAKDSEGNPIAEEILFTFTAELNLHDVNGDRVDDFMVSTPRYDRSTAELDSGAAYLFFGKEQWADVDLANASADMNITVAGGGVGLGGDAKVIGDINGDGFADLAVSAFGVNFDPDSVGLTHNGIVVFLYGGDSMTDVELSPTNLGDSLFYGLNEGWLGFTILPAGDVNGDGLADVILAGRNAPVDSEFWLILGSETAFPAVSQITDTAAAHYIVTGDVFFVGFPVAACDVNGDELDDIVLGSPESDGAGTLRGEVYVVAGTPTPADRDLRTQAADSTITGDLDNSTFGAQLACGDVTGDGLGDIIIGAPKALPNPGRAYVVSGETALVDLDLAVDIPAARHLAAEATDSIGMATCVPGDVNDDGIADYFVGAPWMGVDGFAYCGRGHLFYGATELVSVNFGAGGSADVTYTGSDASAGSPSAMGYCKTVGDINGDGVDDLLLNAPNADANGQSRGKAMVVFGSSALADIDFTSQAADVTISGAGDDDLLTVSPAAF